MSPGTAAPPTVVPHPGRVPAALAHGAGWSIANTPNVTGPQGQLAGVSCVSATWCAAVGELVNHAGGYSPLAEVWNGASWSVTATPGGPRDTELEGVSCSSSRACMAVGQTGSQTLAEKWNGSTWTVVPTPSPKDKISDLSGVSCTAASACTAVGTVVLNALADHGLAVVWNGTRWAAQATPSPGGYSALGGVTCTAAGACTAVGVNAKDGLLVEVRNGTRWTVTPAPDPAKGRYSSARLVDVSCPSPRDCVAVGSAQAGERWHPLAEVWNGAKWVVSPAPEPANGVRSFLSGVSCTSPDACFAVGYYFTGIYQKSGAPFSEVWNGKAWATSTV